MLQELKDLDQSHGWPAQFQRINLESRGINGPTTFARIDKNRGLNRYRDVLPCDHSRVILQDSDTDYINGNLVEVHSVQRKYVLTQGPLPHTCKHFWQMVWEQRGIAIIMLNRVMEKNKIKCHQYYPDEPEDNPKCQMEFGNLRITNRRERNQDAYVVREFLVENIRTQEERTVYHFHYVAWPDFGTPHSSESFLEFLFDVRNSGAFHPSVGPPIVHCSAGIGRSGTFIMVDAALAEIERSQNLLNFNVTNMLIDMRRYRAGLIQTPDQLRFSYITILEGCYQHMHSLYYDAYWKTEGMMEEPEAKKAKEDDVDEVAQDSYPPTTNDKSPEKDGAEERQRKTLPVDLDSSSSSDGETEHISLEDIDTSTSSDSLVSDDSASSKTDDESEAPTPKAIDPEAERRAASRPAMPVPEDQDDSPGVSAIQTDIQTLPADKPQEDTGTLEEFQPLVFDNRKPDDTEDKETFQDLHVNRTVADYTDDIPSKTTEHADTSMSEDVVQNEAAGDSEHFQPLVFENTEASDDSEVTSSQPVSDLSQEEIDEDKINKAIEDQSQEIIENPYPQDLGSFEEKDEEGTFLGKDVIKKEEEEEEDVELSTVVHHAEHVSEDSSSGSSSDEAPLKVIRSAQRYVDPSGPTVDIDFASQESFPGAQYEGQIPDLELIEPSREALTTLYSSDNLPDNQSEGKTGLLSPVSAEAGFSFPEQTIEQVKPEPERVSIEEPEIPSKAEDYKEESSEEVVKEETVTPHVSDLVLSERETTEIEDDGVYPPAVQNVSQHVEKRDDTIEIGVQVENDLTRSAIPEKVVEPDQIKLTAATNFEAIPTGMEGPEGIHSTTPHVPADETLIQDMNVPLSVDLSAIPQEVPRKVTAENKSVGVEDTDLGALPVETPGSSTSPEPKRVKSKRKLVRTRGDKSSSPGESADSGSGVDDQSSDSVSKAQARKRRQERKKKTQEIVDGIKKKSKDAEEGKRTTDFMMTAAIVVACLVAVGAGVYMSFFRDSKLPDTTGQYGL